jgi:hypothetical protein
MPEMTMKKRIDRWLVAVALLLTLNLTGSNACAQGTAFTYQGQLANAGNPANGVFDLRFALYDGLGNTANQIGLPLTNNAVAVSNGFFNVTLDFGAVFTGTNYWLNIGVRPTGGDAFTELNPRQTLTPTPYAIFAQTAQSISGTLPLAQLSGNVLTNGANGLNLGGTFTGNANGLTNVNGSAIATGTINYQRLPAGVVLGLPVVTVSASGLANGATITNNGALFGPDTPGTTTSGLQEAINYFAQVTNRLSAFGGEVDLGNGEFLCSSPLWITNSQIVEFKLKGNGPYKSIIRYTGNQAVNFITVSSVANSRAGDYGSGMNSASIYFDGLAITSSLDTPNWLTIWGACSRGVINNTLWTYWPAATNNGGWGLVFGAPEPSPNAQHLNGLFLAPNPDDLVTMNNPMFSYLANGLQSMVDHTLIIGLNANFIGYYPGSTWPNYVGSTSENYLSIYQGASSFGAAITYLGGLGDNTLITPTIYKCGVGIANLGAGVTGSHMTIFGGREESTTIDYVSTYPSSWDGYGVNSVEWYEPMSNGAFTGRTVTYTGSINGGGYLWLTNFATPANFHIAGYRGSSDFNVMNLATSGSVSAGTFNGSGSGITNQTVTFWTNVISAQFYTNNSSLTLDITVPLQLITASAADPCEVDLLTALNRNSPLVKTASGGSLTPTGPFPVTNFVTLQGVIPPSGYWVVTNNTGIGNSVLPAPGATNVFCYHP